MSAQNFIEASAGQRWTDAQVTPGVGALRSIAGSLDPGEDADLFVVRVDDPASFSCSSIGGASWDTQLWMFDMEGRGISFRDDNPSQLQSTLTGQFLSGPGHVIIGISRFDSDALDAASLELFADAPYAVERQPDGPGAANAFTQWSGALFSAGGYTLRLTGASFAYAADPDEAAVAWAYSNQASPSGEYVPSLNYQYTPTGERVTIERLGVGRRR